jgi:hypothetical protein
MLHQQAIPGNRTNPADRLLLALENPRFQWVLLLLAGIPLLIFYVQASLVFCLTVSSVPPDFLVYLKAARVLAHGGNPYALPVIPDVSRAVNGGYAYPPLCAWLLQPVAGNPLLAYRVYVITGEIMVVAAIVALCWGLRLRSWRARAFLGLGVLGYEPLLLDFAFGQVMVFLFALAAIWYAATARGAAWGHAALGLGIAIKLIQAPMLLPAVSRLRWRWLAVAVVAGAAATIIASPTLLPFYLVHILPGLSVGTGDIRNLGLAGILTRLLHPGPLSPVSDPLYFDVTALTDAWGLLLVSATGYLFLLGRRQDGAALTLDVSIASLLPALIAPLLFATHLVVTLVGIIGLVYAGGVARRWSLVGVALCCWWVTGPAPWATTNYLASHGFNYGVIQIAAALDYVVIFALWAVAVGERLRILRSGARSKRLPRTA